MALIRNNAIIHDSLSASKDSEYSGNVRIVGIKGMMIFLSRPAQDSLNRAMFTTPLWENMNINIAYLSEIKLRFVSDFTNPNAQ